tara:strand:+ start:390 stop:1406 length:1017 start_codon:yes stop_codon:yes gene_type:complete
VNSLSTISGSLWKKLASLMGCGFLFVGAFGMRDVPLEAAQPTLKIGTVNISLVFFFHPRMREYDFAGSRFVKYDPEIAALKPAERLKKRREIASKKIEHLNTGEFNQELLGLQKSLHAKQKELSTAKKELDSLTKDFRKRVQSEIRGLSWDDPAVDQTFSQHKKTFDPKREAIVELIDSAIQEIDIIKGSIKDKLFQVASPEGFTDFMETDLIYWGIRADVRKILEDLSRENGLVTLINSSYLVQDFIPFVSDKRHKMEFPDSATWEDVLEELCRTRSMLTGAFPFTLNDLALPMQKNVSVKDYTVEAVDKLLALYGANDVEISVIRDIVKQQLPSKH